MGHRPGAARHVNTILPPPGFPQAALTPSSPSSHVGSLVPSPHPATQAATPTDYMKSTSLPSWPYAHLQCKQPNSSCHALCEQPSPLPCYMHSLGTPGPVIPPHSVLRRGGRKQKLKEGVRAPKNSCHGRSHNRGVGSSDWAGACGLHANPFRGCMLPTGCQLDREYV